jgi:hypothetical protein
MGQCREGDPMSNGQKVQGQGLEVAIESMEDVAYRLREVDSCLEAITRGTDLASLSTSAVNNLSYMARERVQAVLNTLQAWEERRLRQGGVSL